MRDLCAKAGYVMKAKKATAEVLVASLREAYFEWLEARENFGSDDWFVEQKYAELVGRRDMVEAAIGKAVSIDSNGRVSFGF